MAEEFARLTHTLSNFIGNEENVVFLAKIVNS